MQRFLLVSISHSGYNSVINLTENSTVLHFHMPRRSVDPTLCTKYAGGCTQSPLPLPAVWRDSATCPTKSQHSQTTTENLLSTRLTIWRTLESRSFNQRNVVQKRWRKPRPQCRHPTELSNVVATLQQFQHLLD